jgi:hypothetical protein
MQIAEQPRRANESAMLRWVPTLFLDCFADLNPGPNPTGLSRSLWLRGSSLWPWDGAIIILREARPARARCEPLARTRSIWPVGQPVQFQLDYLGQPEMLVGDRTIRARIRCREREAVLEQWEHAPDVGFVCRMGVGGGDRVHWPMEAGTHSGIIDGEIERTVGGFSWVQRRWHRPFEFRVVTSFSDAMPGRDSPELQQRVRESLVAGPEDETAMIWWSPRPYVRPPAGLHFELIRENTVIDSGTSGDGCVFLRWRVGDYSPAHPSGRTPIPREIAETLWVRVSGNAEASLQVFDREWFWSGTVEVNLQELLERRERQRTSGN